MKENFPSESFRNAGRHLPAKIVEEVRSLVPPEDYDRWVRFLSYWGGRPNTQEELAHFSPRVASVFGLDPRPFKPTGEVQAQRQVGQTPTAGTSKGAGPIQGPPSVTATSHRNEAEVALENSLETWRNGQRMGQTEANQLRKLLAEATDSFINWDWDLFKPNESVPSFYRNIYIPNAQGNSTNTEDSVSTMFSVCSEADLKNPDRSAQICLAILAVYRFHSVHKASWNYPEAQTDLPHCTALIQGFVDRARSFVLGRYFKAQFDPVPALVQGLLIGAKALGLDPQTRGRDLAGSINSLFELPSLNNENPVVTTLANPTAPPSDWQDFLSALRACRIKTSGSAAETWIDHLLNLLGARQGGARTVHAIDVGEVHDDQLNRYSIPGYLMPLFRPEDRTNSTPLNELIQASNLKVGRSKKRLTL